MRRQSKEAHTVTGCGLWRQKLLHMEPSKLGKINARDLWRSLLMLVLGVICTALFECADMLITGEPMNIADLWASLKVGLITGAANIIKQLATDGQAYARQVASLYNPNGRR